MNNDGIGQMGAGASDMRLAGKDLQHARQESPIKQAINLEMDRHSKAKELRLNHLKQHYER